MHVDPLLLNLLRHKGAALETTLQPTSAGYDAQAACLDQFTYDKFREHRGTNLLVESAQGELLPVDEVRLGAVALEDARKLAGDVAPSDDTHLRKSTRAQPGQQSNPSLPPLHPSQKGDCNVTEGQQISSNQCFELVAGELVAGPPGGEGAPPWRGTSPAPGPRRW